LLGLGLFSGGKTRRASNEPKRPARAPSNATPQAPTETPTQAAAGLADYLRGGGSFGDKARPNPEVSRVQRVLGLTPPDGIVGPKLRNAARALGVILPLRPTRANAPRITNGGQS
jgi:hypothetical protein